MTDSSLDTSEASTPEVRAPDTSAPEGTAAEPGSRVRSLAAYFGVGLLALGLIAWLLQLHERDLRVPFWYFGDAIYYATQLKNFVEHGSFMHLPALGAPGEVMLHDFPNAEPFHFWIMSGLHACGFEVGTCLNVYYLLGYPLTAIVTMFVLRRFALGIGPAAFSAILFTFLYYHLARGVIHICLASYYMVPLMMMVILWVMQPGAVFFRGTPRRGVRVAAALLISGFFATAHIYYSFFACYLLLVAGIAAGIVQRSIRPLVASGLLIAVITAVFATNLLDTRRFVKEHGPNTEAAVRHAADAETYALKLTHLVLPVTDHRIGALKRLKDDYNDNLGFGAGLNESNMASLGIVGSLGFLVLLFLILFRLPRRPETPEASLPRDLSILNLALVLLGTVGGIGMVFAVLVSPLIRSYNRVSIMIAFCALFVVAIGLDAVRRRWAAEGRRAIALHVLLAGFLLAGLLDQVPKKTSRDQELRILEHEQARFASDRAFVTKIRARMPDGAMIFQLPHQGFPEEPPKGEVRMFIYDHLLGYLHAEGLRWSFGAVRGRAAHAWSKRTAALPPKDLLRRLCVAGFTGLWVDSFGYTAEQRREIGVEIVNIVGEPTIPSENGRYYFFDLRDHAARLREATPAVDWDAEQARFRAEFAR